MIVFECLSAASDKVVIEKEPQGMVLSVYPKANIETDSAYDLFTVGLRIPTLKNALRVLGYGQKYITNDRNSTFWKTPGGELQLGFKLQHMDGKYYFCELNIEDSQKALAIWKELIVDSN